MMAAVRGVGSTLFIATGILYVFSVIFTQWAQNVEDENIRELYGHLGESMLTFLSVALYDDAFNTIRKVWDADLLFGFLIMLFVLLAAFTVLNMLVGVIVEIVAETQKHEEETNLLHKIAEAFDILDIDGNGMLSHSELHSQIEILEKCGIPAHVCHEALDLLEEAELPILEFVDLIFRLMRPIQSIDVVQISQGLAKLCDFTGADTQPAVVCMDIRTMDDDGNPKSLDEIKREQKEKEKRTLSQVVPHTPESPANHNSGGFANVSSGGSVNSAEIAISTLDGSEDDEEGMKDMEKRVVHAASKLTEDESNELLMKGERSWMANLVRTAWFGHFILVVICINALWLGMELEFNKPEELDSKIKGGPLDGISFFVIVENVFCFIFTFEIVARVVAYKRAIFFVQDSYMWKWNIFDGVLVALMIFENWIVLLFPELSGGDTQIFSILRLLRLLRISRLIRNVPELVTMVKSLAAAARSVSSTLLLLIGLVYVFAIIFTQFGQTAKGANAENIQTEYFGNLFLSSITLLQTLVYDDAFAIVLEILENNFWYGILLLAFMIAGSFTVLNMLIGVICEIVSETTNNEEERIMHLKCKELFVQFDDDLSGTITRSEYERRKDLIAEVGLEPEACRGAFELGDIDQTDCLALNEFIGMCFKLSKAPGAHDMLLVIRNLKKMAVHIGCEKLFKVFGSTRGNIFNKLQKNDPKTPRHLRSKSMARDEFEAIEAQNREEKRKPKEAWPEVDDDNNNTGVVEGAAIKEDSNVNEAPSTGTNSEKKR